jgi:hypothetical protein
MLRFAGMAWCVCGCRSPWANEAQYTGLNEAATKENDNGLLCWIGRVRQRRRRFVLWMTRALLPRTRISRQLQI